jgi:hypothetical protein
VDRATVRLVAWTFVSDKMLALAPPWVFGRSQCRGNGSEERQNPVLRGTLCTFVGVLPIVPNLGDKTAIEPLVHPTARSDDPNFFGRASGCSCCSYPLWNRLLRQSSIRRVLSIPRRNARGSIRFHLPIDASVDVTDARNSNTGFRDRPATPAGRVETRAFRVLSRLGEVAHTPSLTPTIRRDASCSVAMGPRTG